MASLYANRKYSNDNGWQDRHNKAVDNVNSKSFESALTQMLRGWAEYGYDYKECYESPIGDDGVLGTAWESIGDGLRDLLNGELGRLDGGTLDAFILDTMSENGVDPSYK